MKKTSERRIIAFDMDGTLLNHKKKISFLTKTYLKKLTKQGHIIVLASGRPSRSLYKYYNELKLKTPMICYNGAYVFNPYDEKFPKIEFEFPKEIVVEVLAKIKPHIKNVMCETDTEIWVDKKDEYLEKYFWYDGMDIHYGDLAETLNKNPMTCIVQTPYEYRETHDIDNALVNYPQIAARFWTGCPYFELFYKETSKGNALRKMCEYYNIPIKDLIVFGDATNDIEMFEAAGVSVLMKNAKYDLKEKVTMVSLKDNNHNGIYYTLKKLLA
jgi:hypothetical protein